MADQREGRRSPPKPQEIDGTPANTPGGTPDVMAEAQENERMAEQIAAGEVREYRCHYCRAVFAGEGAQKARREHEQAFHPQPDRTTAED
jgi:hypothetical protein